MKDTLQMKLQKNSKYKLAIFDMDGTILNTIEDLADSTNYALEAYNMPVRTLEEIRNFVGNGMKRLIELAVPCGTSNETIENVLNTMKGHYKEHCTDKTKAYDGIKEVLEELRSRGIITAVVSNKADFGVQILCEDYFKGLFDFAVGQREGIRRKPYPDSVIAVLKKFGVDKENAVYIGDSEVDLKTSQNAGMDIIMVGWGFREEKFLIECGAKFVIHKPAEILAFFSL